MTKKSGRFIYWTPRVLSILFILFLVLFSLDVFGENLGFWGTIIGLFMHNIPALILLIILIISWKHEIVGGIGFVLAGISYFCLILIQMFRTGFEWYYLAWMIEISGIAFLIGALYLVGWFKKKKSKR